MGTKTSFETLFIARQPIFRSDETVWGYELLFRSDAGLHAVIDDADQATSSVIVDGLTLASEGMDTSAKVLINFTESLLAGDIGLALPKDRCVIEILETARPDKATLGGVRRLKAAGYTLALDDYSGQSRLEPFLDYVDIVKVDALALDSDPGRISDVITGLSEDQILLGEKVEDFRTFRELKGMDFSLYQGFFFSKPEIVPGKKLTSGELTKLQLLAELANPDVEPARLAEILKSDPSLSYRLFRYINAAGRGLWQEVTSVKRAIDMMGMYQAKLWLRSVLMADCNTSPRAGELSYLAVQRGKFLEQICHDSNLCSCDADALFMTGLFSLLDAMLEVEMETILEVLPLEKKVVEGLLGQGEFHDLLRLAASYERGMWSEAARRIKKLGLTTAQTELFYVQARSWAQGMLGVAGQS